MLGIPLATTSPPPTDTNAYSPSESVGPLPGLEPPACRIVGRFQILKDSIFAARGNRDPARFKWNMFSSFIKELQLLVPKLLTHLAKYIFWEYPFFSATLFVSFQVVVSNVLLLPACVPLLMLVAIIQSAILEGKEAHIHSQPPMPELLRCVVCGGEPSPLFCGPEVDGKFYDSMGSDDLDNSDDDLISKDEAEAQGTSAVVDGQLVTKKQLRKRAASNSVLALGQQSLLAEEMERLKQEVREKIDADEDEQALHSHGTIHYSRIHLLPSLWLAQGAH